MQVEESGSKIGSSCHRLIIVDAMAASLADISRRWL
jgi:hypothetical protein